MRLFLSAHREFFSESENAARNEALKQDLVGLGVRQVQDVKGCYKGIVEDSFAVLKGDVEVKAIFELARKYQQESVLLETMTGVCYLVYANGDVVEEIGGMFQVDKPNDNEDYSIIEGKFYVIRQ
jgi:hypothetical protein